MSFKELVNKKAFYRSDDRAGNYDPEPLKLELNDIGKWAWKQLENSNEIHEYLEDLNCSAEPNITLESIEEFADKGEWICIYWEIIISCFSFLIVKNKLEELNKNE